MLFKPRTFLVVLSFFLLNACDKPQPANPTSGFAIVNVTVIHPESAPQPGMNVWVSDGRIQSVTSTASQTLPTDLPQIDGSDKFLMPGLWDMHVHLSYEPRLDEVIFGLFLAHGVTAVRDTGGQLDQVKAWRQKSLDNPTTSPHVKIAGPLIDGHNVIYNGEGNRPLIGTGAGSPAAVEKLVDDLAAADVDFLKAYELLEPDTFKALIKRAEKHNLLVTGHVPLSMDAIDASNAGLNSIEHFRNLPLACASNSDELLLQRKQLLANTGDDGATLRASIHQAQRSDAISNYDPVRCRTVVKTLAENKTWQIPTLTLNTGAKDRRYASARWRESFSMLPASVAQAWNVAIEGITSWETPQQYKQLSEWSLMIVPLMMEHQVKIMPGTDTPIFFLTPGFSLHEELAVLVEAGYSPQQALAAATIEPARYFSIDDQMGSITSGKLADMVLLTKNPLDDIRNTLTIDTVIKKGAILDRQKLDALLNASDAN